jgi:hypothetical protein
MFDFLFETSIVVYVLLGLLAAYLFLKGQQNKDRRFRRAAAAVVLLALVLFLLSRLHETDSVKARRTLEVVTDLINRGEYDKAFAYFADDFQAYNRNRDTIRAAAESALSRHGIRNIKLKSVSVEKQDRGQRLVTLRFNATADNNFTEGWGMTPCEVDFVVDREGRCKVKSFRVYQPFIDNLQPWDPFQR